MVEENKNLEKIPVKNLQENPVIPGQEQINRPEQAPTQPEKPKAAENTEQKEAKTEGEAGLGSQYAVGGVDSQTQNQINEIENVLAEGLEDAFMSLPDNKKQEFKQTGEETARKINELYEKGKATARKVIDLIKKWLSIIPGVNKFFLEQEAKIKADRIQKIKTTK